MQNLDPSTKEKTVKTQNTKQNGTNTNSQNDTVQNSVSESHSYADRIKALQEIDIPKVVQDDLKASISFLNMILSDVKIMHEVVNILQERKEKHIKELRAKEQEEKLLNQDK